MKHTFFYNIYVWAVCLVLFALPAGAQHIRVVPQQVSVRNDSLQLQLDMDLEAVNVSASTASIAWTVQTTSFFAPCHYQRPYP